MNRKKNPYLRTCDLARAAGVHVNTVRQYEKWRLIPAVERSENGYRHYTRRHLDCLLLARMVYHEPYPGQEIRRIGKELIAAAVAGDLQMARQVSVEYRLAIEEEIDQAERAASALEQWAASDLVKDETQPLSSGQAARRVRISKDMLRHWERCGLVNAQRNPENRYRQYGAPEIERLSIIRMLIRSGYSTMAILRMLTRLDEGKIDGLRDALDTPRPDEEILSASDRWLSTLQEELERIGRIQDFLSKMEGSDLSREQ